jgi:hypothetical protein
MIEPKSTACFFNILENKMTGGETARFAATFYLILPGYGAITESRPY